MKLKPNQLTTAYLNKQGLALLYLITGDEPLQMKECTDTLRSFARSQGFTERLVWLVDKSFNWSNLDQYANSLSLFARKRWLEIHWENKLPGNDGTQALTKYISRPPPNTWLLMTAAKLETAQQKTKWFSLLDEHGLIIQVKPLEPSQLSGWITQKLANYGLQASAEAVEVLVQRCEGHLLACAQEIEKLYLLYGAGHLGVAQVLEAVADSARFEVFDWVDTVLAGQVLRALRQLQGLRAEGYAAVLISWALNREIRSLGQMATAIHHGQSAEQVFKNYRVWQQRKPVIASALKRHPQPREWYQFLQRSINLERIIKGVDAGDAWEELWQLSLAIAGVNLF